MKSSSSTPRAPFALFEPLEPRQMLAVVPQGFTDTAIVSQIDSPTAIAFAPDGRILIAQKTGQLRIVKDGNLLPSPLLTLPVDTNGERGLIGVELDPAFGTAGNNFVYVHYTVPGNPPHNRVSRFTISGDTVNAGSEQILLELDPQGAAQAHFDHNGGAIHFGPDGKLYITVGDNRQNLLGKDVTALTNFFGKMLRINRDGTIPTDNPYYNQASGKYRAIWAKGLRNPFTFSFHAGTGRMFINDVGEAAWEEINEASPAADFGWPSTEGPTSNPAYTSPFYAYHHDTGPVTGCAISGGDFYDAASFPASYRDDYLFLDFCEGWIKSIDTATKQVTTLATGIMFPAELQVHPDGSVYYLEMGGLPNGTLRRIQYTAGTAPSITQHPTSQTRSPGQSVTFSVVASGTQPLDYQWQRGNVNIPGATAPSYTLDGLQPADNGATFRVIVTNPGGSTPSNPAILTVTSNQSPTATITAPSSGALYRAGDTINFAATAADPEDGELPPAAFSWHVDFHHDDHLHPFMPTTAGIKSGSFTIPTAGETSANVFFRIHLTVTDSQGRSHSIFRDVQPITSPFTIQTSPPGLSLNLDGQPRTNPLTVTGVVAVQRELSAPLTQSLNGVTYEFVSWSDAGAATHVISTPNSPTTYTATYRAVTSAALTLTGTGADDAFTLRLDPTGQNLLVTQNGSTTSHPLGSFSSISVNGLAGNNSLTVDFAGGSPVPAAGLVFIGGTAPHNVLKVLGKPSNTAADNLTLEFGASGRNRLAGSIDGRAFSSIEFDYGTQLQLDPGPNVNALSVGGGITELYLAPATTALAANAGIIIFTESNTLRALHLSGSAQLYHEPGSSAVLHTSALSVTGQALLDLADNAMILQAPSPFTRDSALSHTTSRIASARNAPADRWAGPGITTQSATLDSLTTLGVIPNLAPSGAPLYDTFLGHPVNANSVLIRFTLEGDADLDGRLTISDFFAADSGRALRQSTFARGDFDYSGGPPTADDLMLLDRSFLSQPAASAFAPSPAHPITPLDHEDDDDRPITHLPPLF